MYHKEEMKIAIVGTAVSHSMSPAVHKAFGGQCRIRVVPTLEQIDGDDHAFFETMARLAREGYRGVTVAQPFKELAYLRLCNETTARAQYAGAVNTVRITADGAFIGENTDGYGLVNDIQKNFGFAIAGKRILLLGAGGAACGVVKPLLDESPNEIVITNRTMLRAAILARRFHTPEIPVIAKNLEQLSGSFDLVVNATSSSMHKQLPGRITPTLVTRHSLCYDLYYQRQGLTAFEEWAWGEGARPANGVGMVVEQGAVAFNHWCNRDKGLNTKKLVERIPFHRSVDAMTANVLFSRSSQEQELVNQAIRDISTADI